MSSRRASLAAAVATSTLVGWSYAGYASVAVLIAADLGLDDVQLGLIATALYLAAGVPMLFFGDVADRFGPKAVNTWGIVLVVAGTAGMALAPTYPALLATRAVSGIGAGLGLLGGLRYIGRRYEGQSAHFGTGLYGGGFPLGSAVALWTVPPVAATTDWRVAFLATALVMVAIVALWVRVPAVPRMARPGNMLVAVRDGNCWWTFVQHAAGFGLVLAAGAWVSVFLIREFGLPLAVSGILGSLLLVVAFLARPLGGLLVSRDILSTLAVMRVAQLVVLGGIGLLVLPDRPLALALLGTVAVGFGGGIPYAAVFNTAAASLPGAPAAAQGLTALGGLVSALVAAPAMGYAIQTWGFSPAWLLLASVSVVALAGTFVMRGEEQFAAAGTNAAAG
jgi:nitrate/nitrite transporter NarK